MRRIAVGLVAAMAVLVAAGPARADDAMPIRGFAIPGGIFAAFGSQVLWQQLDPVPPGGTFSERLWSGFGPAAAPLRAPAVHREADYRSADLGVDAHGRLEAVYSRCRPVDRYGARESCAVYAYSFSAGGERRVDSTGCDEGEPLLDRGVLIFARLGAWHAFLPPYPTSLDGTPSRRCRVGFWIKRPGRRLTPLRLPGGCVPSEFTEGFLACGRKRRRDNHDGTDDITDEILTLRLGHQRHWRVVARSSYTSTRGGDFGSRLCCPVISGHYVYWSKSNANQIGDVDLQRRRLAGGPVQTLNRAGRVSAVLGTDFAVAGQVLYYTADVRQGIQPVDELCRVRITPGLFR